MPKQAVNDRARDGCVARHDREDRGGQQEEHHAVQRGGDDLAHFVVFAGDVDVCLEQKRDRTCRRSAWLGLRWR
eukprot:4330793-Prymnesium_polylepis.1